MDFDIKNSLLMSETKDYKIKMTENTKIQKEQKSKIE